MKYLAKKSFWWLVVVILLSVTLVGCSKKLSKEELEKQVMASIEETINASDAYGKYMGNTTVFNYYKNLEVKMVSLVKRSENEYIGSATIYGKDSSTGKEKTVKETITVIVDEDSFQWKFE